MKTEMERARSSTDEDWKMLNLGNSPLSFEMARNVLLHSDHREKVFTEVPYFIPVGGQAYLFQSSLPLCKLHAKFDPFKFLYLGKGYNKEFAILKRYYHLKHNRTELDKNLYNFQRHIYCLATEENDRDTYTIYLVHYFGNDYLLQDAPYRKGAVVHPDVPKVTLGSLDSTEYDPPPVQEAEEPFIPPLSGGNDPDPIGAVEYIPTDYSQSSSHKRKSTVNSSPIPKNRRKLMAPEPSDSPPSIAYDYASLQALKAIQGPDYLFAINMASQLQQLPLELKAKVKFQIATVFYEAEMRAVNGNFDDD